MTTYRTQIQDPTAPQINPYIGMYQDSFGSSVSQGARSIASDMSSLDSTRSVNARNAAAERRYAEDRQMEIGTKLSLSEAALSMINVAESGAYETIDGMPLSGSDVNTLNSAARDSRKLQMATQQNPGSTRNKLRESANLRKLISQSPLVAPEIMSMYNATAGKGIVEQLNDVTVDAETQRKETLNYYRDEYRKIGGVAENVSEQAMIEAVATANRNKFRAEATQQEFMMRNALDGLSGREALERTRSEIMPGILGDIDKGVIAELESIDDPASMKPEQRLESVARLDKFEQDQRDKLRSSMPVSVTEDEFKRVIAPMTERIASARDYLSGKSSLDQYERQNKINEAASEAKIYDLYPELRGINAFAKALDDLPESFATKFMQETLGQKLSGTMESVGAQFSEIINAQNIERELKLASSPEQKRKLITERGLGISAVANLPNTTSENYLNVIGQYWGQYSSSPSSGEYRQMIDGMLPDLATPKSLELISKATNQDKLEALNSGLNKYMVDVGTAMHSKIETALNEAKIVSPDIGSRPGQPGIYVNWLENVQQYVDTKFLPDGGMRFTPKPNLDPRFRSAAREVADAANKASGRVVNIINVQRALGNTTIDGVEIPPAKVSEYFFNTGKWPTSLVQVGEAEAQANTGKTPEQQRTDRRPPLPVVDIQLNDLF